MRVPRARAEEARGVMVQLFPEGFEETEHDRDIELAAYTTPGGEERLWHVFGPGAARDVAPGWEDAWKRFHRPVRVGRLWVGPPWEEPDAGALAVVIDPGGAFGTGAHPTTRLCLELMLELKSSSFVDLGCGSGVLAIAAAKLGFEPVYALDDEEAAVSAVRGNAAANGVVVQALRADVLNDSLPDASVAAVNITRALTESVAVRVGATTLVASGYVSSERPDLAGWRHEARKEREGWAADLFQRD
ncbi:MAG: 50S ribosomal protein L11 methyltransferase [Gaiellales bacterium]